MVKYLPFHMIKIVQEKLILMIWNSHTLMEVEIFTGIFVTKAKEEFSNSQNANIEKWGAYISRKVNRQDYLRTALDWVSKGNIDAYMSKHRYDDNINELKSYFNSVIDWISSVFPDVDDTMRGLEWGKLYELFHKNAYNPQEVSDKVSSYLEDFYVKDKKVIYEYVLNGCVDKKLLNIRVFDDIRKKSVYSKQTNEAKRKKNQIVLFVLWVQIITRIVSGN